MAKYFYKTAKYDVLLLNFTTIAMAFIQYPKIENSNTEILNNEFFILFLGTPKEILFDQSSPTSKRLYVATEHNVLAHW